MTTASAVRFQVAESGARRVVVSAGRPDLRSPKAHPARPVSAGRVGSATSCVVDRPEPKASPWLMLKVAAVGLIAVIGGAVSVQGLVLAEPDPALEYVAGDPAWAHVTLP